MIRRRIINSIISFPVQTVRLIDSDHGGQFLFWNTRQFWSFFTGKRQCLHICLNEKRPARTSKGIYSLAAHLMPTDLLLSSLKHRREEESLLFTEGGTVGFIVCLSHTHTPSHVTSPPLAGLRRRSVTSQTLSVSFPLRRRVSEANTELGTTIRCTRGPVFFLVTP